MDREKTRRMNRPRNIRSNQVSSDQVSPTAIGKGDHSPKKRIAITKKQLTPTTRRISKATIPSQPLHTHKYSKELLPHAEPETINGSDGMESPRRDLPQISKALTGHRKKCVAFKPPKHLASLSHEKSNNYTEMIAETLPRKSGRKQPEIPSEHELEALTSSGSVTDLLRKCNAMQKNHRDAVERYNHNRERKTVTRRHSRELSQSYAELSRKANELEAMAADNNLNVEALYEEIIETRMRGDKAKGS